MGRHADTTARRRLPSRTLIAGGTTLALVAGGGTWWAVSASGGECADTRTVRVTVAPEVSALTQDLLTAPVPVADGVCAAADVTAQEPLQTVGDLGALDSDALPHLWVPDSSLWPARAGKAPLDPAGSLASSPVVLATSRAVADDLGWADAAPTWGEAVGSGRALAVPDLAASAEGLAALAAVRESLGGDEAADNAVVQAVLAAARGGAITPADGLAAGSAGDADAPLVPVSEQEVLSSNQGTTDPSLVAVYPEEGSPQLDYPVLRVGDPDADARAAVDAVVDRLTSADAQAAARTAGFRTGEGTAPADAGEGTGIREEAPAALPMDPAQVQELLGRLSSLAAPSRILAVIDVSTSMKAPVGGGTRVTLARDAAKSALTLIPSRSAIGLWGFAYHLRDDEDWSELVPTRRLDADVDGRSQREVLDEELDSLPDRLAPGGTGLYDTVLAAVRAARADFDPTAVSTVVIVTDGTNDDDPSGIQLDALLDTVADEADPDRPVKVVGVALGPDADLSALRQIGDATGGDAYSAVDPEDLQTVLFDALRQRD